MPPTAYILGNDDDLDAPLLHYRTSNPYLSASEGALAIDDDNVEKF
jgi:hypothetical protein